MADEKYTFEQARIRLEEIAAEVRKKDTSLEKSLDLLEEGVRLANICTELVDHPDVSASVPVPEVELGQETAQENPTADDSAASLPDVADEETPVDDGAGESLHDGDEVVDDTDDGFDTDGFDDVEEPSLASSEEETQD